MCIRTCLDQPTRYNLSHWWSSPGVPHCAVVCPPNVTLTYWWVNGEHCLVGTCNRINYFLGLLVGSIGCYHSSISPPGDSGSRSTSGGAGESSGLTIINQAAYKWGTWKCWQTDDGNYTATIRPGRSKIELVPLSAEPCYSHSHSKRRRLQLGPNYATLVWHRRHLASPPTSLASKDFCRLQYTTQVYILSALSGPLAMLLLRIIADQTSFVTAMRPICSWRSTDECGPWFTQLRWKDTHKYMHN